MKPTLKTAEVHIADPYVLTHNRETNGGGSFFGHLWASIASTLLLLIICCGIYPVVVWGLAQAIFPYQANGSLVKSDGTRAMKDEEAVGSALLGQNFAAAGYFHPRPSAAGAGYDATSSSGSNLGPLSDKLINGVTQVPATQPADTTTAATAPTTTPAETLVFDGLRLRAIHYAVDNNIAFKLFEVAPDGSRSEVLLSKFQDAQGNLNDVALVDAFPHPTTPDDDKRTTLVADNFATLIPGDAVTASGSGLDPHITPANAHLQCERVAKTRNVSADLVQRLVEEHTDRPSVGFLGDPGVNVLMLNLALDAKYPVPAPSTQPSAK